MGRMFLIILFVAASGCSTLNTAPGIIGDYQTANRAVRVITGEAGRTARAVGRDLEEVRQGWRRGQGAVTNGALILPLENWHAVSCTVNPYSRQFQIPSLTLAPNQRKQLGFPEDIVEGTAEVTVSSNCGGIRTVDRIEIDFRRGFWRINGGRAEHELLILKPEGRQSRVRVNERHERYAQPEHARVEPTVIRHRQSSALRACNALPEPRRSDCVRANS